VSRWRVPRLGGKPWRYWAYVSLFILLGVGCGDLLDSHYVGLEARYWAYQKLAGIGPRGVEAPNVAVVKIGDDEFWLGGLDRRTPIKRDYLARLVEALAAADPSVIALDFNLDAPVQGTRVASEVIPDSPDYIDETKQLIAAVERVAKPTLKVVLPLTLDYHHYSRRTDDYPVNLTIFGDHRFPPTVWFGFINPRWDLRHVPISSAIRWPRRRIPSFARQVAIAKNVSIHVPNEQDGVLYGRFLKEEDFAFQVSAHDVLGQPQGSWRSLVAHRVALVGSFAHADGVGLGGFIDNFYTPVGDAPGVLLHANYVEAFLDRRVFGVLPGWVAKGIEILISFSVSWLFVSSMNYRAKLRWLVLLASSALLLSYFCLQNLGVFFDPYLPSLFVIGHGAGEQAIEAIRSLVHDSRELRHLQKHSPMATARAASPKTSA